ncbi:hypothetical protein HIM_09706 [Hirsutella minnesotensis 3608]|uniref:Cytochrome P450 n=1 Tax=Hirsutella minnesotensis 3608 TaxID=1043627 RepID=A0A0F7ZS83_9HYPO|nr:hypothetical protein HIM_09706 [Hirsutella minnesotensis 3608]
MTWRALVLVALALLPAAFVVDTCVRLRKNYAAARTIGAPIRIVPFSPLNPLWVLLDRKVLSYVRRLPFGENSFTKYNWRGWEVEDRYRSHQEMGDLWVLVTPLKNWIYVNDPEALMSLFKRSADFPRPVFVNEILSVFGPNISCAEGQPWKTQRRMVTRCFNEQNNEIVWSESVALAGDMLRYWSSKTSIRSADHDFRTFSLHVLSRAGFGKSFKFRGHDEKKPEGVTSSSNYKESLHTILENCILIMAIGPKNLAALAKYWLPSGLRVLHDACASFQAYMTNIYEEEKRRYAQGEASNNNLMTSLVRASQDEGEETGGLTESEIYGNMFVINFAGHDTTSHTFTFAIYFLAAHPEVQDWISEEIKTVLDGKRPQDWDYRSDFHRLKRCLSIMLETLRLYTPVPSIKWTGDKAQPLTVGDKTFVLPPHSMIAPSYGSVQTDPRFWGSDSLEWRPSRWINSSDKSSTGSVTTPGDEELDMHTRGAFIGWSEGSRDCPGKKFSQVEFVAAMAVLFKDSRVEPLRTPGETAEAAQRRVLDLIKTDTGSVLLLQMLHPERAPLVWKKT